MLTRLAVSYFIVVRWNLVKLITEDICGRWLGVCRISTYVKLPCHLSRLSSYRQEDRAENAAGPADAGGARPGHILGVSGRLCLGRAGF